MSIPDSDLEVQILKEKVKRYDNIIKNYKNDHALDKILKDLYLVITDLNKQINEVHSESVDKYNGIKKNWLSFFNKNKVAPAPILKDLPPEVEAEFTTAKYMLHEIYQKFEIVNHSTVDEVLLNSQIIIHYIQNDLSLLDSGAKLDKHWNQIHVIDAKTGEKKIDEDLPRDVIKERQHMGTIKNKEILEILKILPRVMENFAMKAEAIYKSNKAKVTVIIDSEITAAVNEFASTALGKHVIHLQKAQSIKNEGSIYYESKKAYIKHLNSELALADQALTGMDENSLKKAALLTKVDTGNDKEKMAFILFSESKFNHLMDKIERKLKSALNLDPNSVEQYKRPTR